MVELDLAAERAKRTRESKTLTMRGDDGEILSKYELVAELPVETLDLATEGMLGAAIRQLFQSPEEAEEFVSKYKPSIDDLIVILKNAYGMDAPLGESSASGS